MEKDKYYIMYVSDLSLAHTRHFVVEWYFLRKKAKNIIITM